MIYLNQTQAYGKQMTVQHSAKCSPRFGQADWLSFDLTFLPAGFERKARRLARAGLAFCLIAITLGSLAPPSLADLGATGIGDKTAHLVGYAGTMACAAFAAGASRARLGWGAFLIVYGALMELGQAAMAQGREASWGDMAANSAGIVIGAIIAALLVRMGHLIWQRNKQRLS